MVKVRYKSKDRIHNRDSRAPVENKCSGTCVDGTLSYKNHDFLTFGDCIT